MTQTGPLTDEEIATLDQFLARVPEAHDPMDVVMLDGYLTAVLLQPTVVLPSDWLPLILDANGRPVEDHPEGLAGHELFLRLLMRRYNELAASIAAREAFDPLVFELLDEKTEMPLEGDAAIEALAPWAAGFAAALDAFPALDEIANPDLEVAMLGILRHAPAGEDADPQYLELLEAMRRDVPLESLDEAIDDLLANVMTIADIARPNVPAVRGAPKVGRNDPCPCGSGRKYKLCHGAN
jgi:uncharacterized protein